MKKIILIEPPAPGVHVFKHFILPRLGLPILARALKNKGFEVDLYVKQLTKTEIKKIISEAYMVGLSSTSSTSTKAYEYADIFKKHNIPVVLGGSHFTFLPDEALDHADFVIRGEGESSFLELIDEIEGSKEYHKINGLSYSMNDKKIHNPDRELLCNLDEVPFPDFSNMKLPKGKKLSIKPLQTTRGCPFNCTFCSVTPMFGKRMRTRSIENVLEELRSYKNLHEETMFFYDDNFTGNKRFTKELLNRMIETNLLPRSWSAQVRSDLKNDPELLDLMQKAHCSGVYIGFESINPDTLKNIKKSQSNKDIEDSIDAIHQRNIEIHGMFFFGEDNDKKESITETVKFCLKNKIESIQFLVLTPLPGTELYKKYDEEKKIHNYDWKFYDAQHVVHYPKNIHSYDLQKLVFNGMQKFYSFKRALNSILKLNVKQTFLTLYANRLITSFFRENKLYMKYLESIKKEHIKEEALSALTSINEKLIYSTDNFTIIEELETNDNSKGYQLLQLFKDKFAKAKQNFKKKNRREYIPEETVLISEFISKFVKTKNQLLVNLNKKQQKIISSKLLNEILKFYNDSTNYLKKISRLSEKDLFKFLDKCKNLNIKLLELAY